MPRPPRPGRSVGAALVRGAAWLRRRGFDDARLDADLLLGEVLGVDRAGLVIRGRDDVSRTDLLRFARLLRRRRDHEPVAYLRGRREFAGLELTVGPGVLVPRPETEELVDRSRALLPPAGAGRVVRALDVGTGSGAIALALAAARPDLEVVALDRSRAAARCADANAARLGLGARVRVLVGDVRTLAHTFAPESFDLFVSNPPYVAPDEPRLATELRHEPRLALVGEVGPFPAVYARLAAAAERLLRAGGALCVEVGAGQAERVGETIAATRALSPVAVAADLAGVERVVSAVRRARSG
ncbi:MAG: peptide chain release factor N(5)-glutamine methyltransferase [Planctomycetota bacterium JB042]